MKKTENYAMPYPEQDDYFNVEDFQNMMVSVDNLMKKISDSGAQISSDAEHLYNQTKAQMDNIQKRMNIFTALKDGSTTGDAELKDIRVAYDGKEYGNAGEAVREQASDIHKALFGAGASIWSKAKSESTKYVAETKGICILNERFTAAGVVTKISRGTFAQNESTLNLDRECSAYIVEFEKNPGTVYMPSAETIKIVSTTKIIFEANGNARCWIPVKKGQYLAVDSTATAYTSESNHVPYMLYNQANKTLEYRGFGSTGSIEPVDPYSLALEYKLEYDMDDTGLVKQIDANREATASLKEDLTNNIDAVYSGTKNLKSEIEWFYGSYFGGYFHDNEPGNEVISKPFIPNNLLKLVVRKISDNVDYQIDVCESTYNENDKIVLEGSTNINVLNNTASVGEEGNYEFTTGKTYSIRLLKSPNSSIIVTDKTALNYFSIDLIGNGINKNTENITEIEAHLVELENKLVNLLPDCSNKKIVLFGDSLFACSNDGGAWGGVLQKHFGFGTYISVGIGGSKFIANGKVALPSDFSVGNSLPKTLVVTSDGTTPCAFSDWTRIDATVPSDADIIIVGTGANDCGYGEYWIKEDSVDMPGFVIDGSIEKTPHTGWDTAWQNSDEYVNYNGDWDRSFLGGAIRSTIMKLQAKAPNAKIFVTNWCNSRGTAGQIGTSTHDAKNTENTLSIMKKICNDFGVELIDLFSDSGINPLNRLQYVKDSIHLTDDGYTKMMAQPIVSAVRNYIMSAYN